MHVRPYRGERYWSDKPLGLSILILGESSYHKDEPAGQLSLDWNDRIINCLCRASADPTIKREWRTITAAADLFYDELLSFPDGHCGFFQTAAFANFIQDNLFTADGRKKRRDWKTGEEAFTDYIIDLGPEFVLVDGVQLWKHLPEKNRKDGPPVTLKSTEKPMPYYRPGRGQCPDGVMPSYLYPNDNGYAFVFGIQHTSRSSHDVWRPWVKSAMETAIRFHIGTSV